MKYLRLIVLLSIVWSCSDDDVMGRVWVFRDVSELRSMDMQLRQNQKWMQWPLGKEDG